MIVKVCLIENFLALIKIHKKDMSSFCLLQHFGTHISTGRSSSLNSVKKIGSKTKSFHNKQKFDPVVSDFCLILASNAGKVSLILSTGEKKLKKQIASLKFLLSD